MIDAGVAGEVGPCVLQIGVSAASLRGDVFGPPPEIAPLKLEAGNPLRLRVFIDRSILGVYANGRPCRTIRAYHEQEDSSVISVFARGDAAMLVSLDARQMRGVWPEL